MGANTLLGKRVDASLAGMITATEEVLFVVGELSNEVRQVGFEKDSGSFSASS